MRREFSTREKILLVILAVLLLGCLYYFLVDQTVRNTIEEAQYRTIEAESEQIIERSKLLKLRKMKKELEKNQGEAKFVVPDYDNVQQVLTFLDQVLLNRAYDLDLKFNPVIISDSVAARTIDMQFTCANYQAARQVFDGLYASPYRCEITAFSVVGGKGTHNSKVAITSGEVKVTATITFFEFVKE